MTEELEHFAQPGDFLQFHHVQMYVRKLQPLSAYKGLERSMNALTEQQTTKGKFFGLGAETKAELSKDWREIAADLPMHHDGEYISYKQDVVEQLIVGAGWRVIGYRETKDVRAVLVASNSHVSAKVIVTAPRSEGEQIVDECVPDAAGETGAAAASIERRRLNVESCWNFSGKAQKQFFENHHGRQGIGIMAFEISGDLGVDEVFRNYTEKHPKLLATPAPTVHLDEGNDVFKTLEAYAFYKEGSCSEPDKGTVLQFIEKRGGCENGVLFFNTCKAEFDSMSLPVFPDHWVSNVVNREQYLSTLNDVLGFTPKVNFNAGVVAAGEAIIESTVTGNAPRSRLNSAQDLLENQQQIYLPINNSLSEFGHVHFFIQEVGQGVQHIANRCSDLLRFIQRANDIREITGRGFAFLGIPRSYYGYLQLAHLESSTKKQTSDCEALFQELVKQAVIDNHGVVSLDVDRAKVTAACSAVGIEEPELVMSVIDSVEAARYNHLKQLLGDRLPVVDLLSIVRNKILVDIQGADILYQIFTRNILQDQPNDEAPFLEFIQRVCDAPNPNASPRSKAKEKPIKPGCGGFGIRNFLTLFLSIELSKALQLREAGQREGSELKTTAGNSMVAALTEQLNVSNPILTSISDAMTREEECEEELQEIGGTCDAEVKRKALLDEIEQLRAKKELGQKQLMAVSEKYKLETRRLRSEYEEAAAVAAAKPSCTDEK